MPSEEFVSLHDVNVSQIKKTKKGIRLICKDPFTVVRQGTAFCVFEGSVLYEGAENYDCECYVFYGKATSEGEMLVGIPIDIRFLNRFLRDNKNTIEIYEEYYGYSGTLLKGNLRPYEEGLGVDWKHVIIHIRVNSNIIYTGIMNAT